MINVWKYADAKIVRLTDINGNTWEGYVSDVTDAGERSDLEPQKDGISITISKGRIIEFFSDEVTSIEVLEWMKYD